MTYSAFSLESELLRIRATTTYFSTFSGSMYDTVAETLGATLSTFKVIEIRTKYSLKQFIIHNSRSGSNDKTTKWFCLLMYMTFM